MNPPSQRPKKSGRHDALQAEIAREFPAEYEAPKYEIADIFRLYGAAYRASHPLIVPQLKVMDAIEHCRTTALGGHVHRCEDCGHLEICYNSCRNRHCPKCRASQRFAWMEAREQELLPIQYFHTVFTLPQELIPLTHYNPNLLYSLLFTTAAETLQTFASNRWQGQLGIIMSLHTWGQTLNAHPHVHCIVSGGALKKDHSRFVPAPKNFLFPVKALSRVFRAKFMEKLDKYHQQKKLCLSGQPQLADPKHWQRFVTPLRQRDWVVYAKAPFDQPEHLIRYLGRYVNRIAIANHRIRSIDNGKITFDYKDNRDQQNKVMELSADEFIRRFLSHLLPRYFRQVRYYGFLVNSLRKPLLTLIRQLLGLSNPDQPYIADIEAYLDRQEEKADSVCCPVCGSPNYHPVFSLLSFHSPPAEFLPKAA